MKKIIKAGLLSAVGLCNLISGANPIDLANGGVVMGVVVGESAQSSHVAEAQLSEEEMVKVKEMLGDVAKGFVPQEILELFAELPKIDVSKRADVAAIDRMQKDMKAALERKWTDEVCFSLNAFLGAISKKTDLHSVPLGVVLFGDTTDNFTCSSFINQIIFVYNKLFADADNKVTAQINTPTDWVTVQFLGLFFDNAISNCAISINMPGLGDLDLIKEVIEGLQGATLNILGLWALQDEAQAEILKAIAEIRPKKAKIISNTGNVEFLKSFSESLMHPSLQVFSEGSKIEVILSMNLAELNRHRVSITGVSENPNYLNLHDRETALIEMFESTASRVVPHVWDIKLAVGNFESIAYGNLTPLIRAIVRSPIGKNLALPMLVSDHVSTDHVMTKLREEFLSPESKVQVLNFEGSQITAKGWEQLAQLAESKKPLEKVRLTGMQIPSAISGRLGLLRALGINMAGCNVKATDLTDMVAGWLGEGSILKGVDLRGNDVNVRIATMFLENGFNGYGDEQRGFMFIKSQL